MALTSAATDASGIYYRIGAGEWVYQAGSLASFVVEPGVVGEQAVIEYYSVSAAGTEGERGTGTVEFDLTAPTVSFEQSEPNADGSIDVTVTAADQRSGVGTVAYTLNGADGSVGTGTGSEATLRLHIAAPRWGTGTARLTVTAVDNLGTECDPATWEAVLSNFTPDSEAPWSTFTLTDGEVVVSADGTYVGELGMFDNESGVGSIHYRVDGGDWQEMVGMNDFELTVEGYGSHTVEFYSQDKAGNVESPVNSVTFTIVPGP